EYEVRGGELPQSGCVRLDVRVPFRRRQVAEQPRLDSFVAVEHESGQQTAGQLGNHDACAAEVVELRVPLLADDRDVVPREAPLAGGRRGVAVGPGAAEQVPVPEKTSQVRWKYSE